jgi:hypothetical protein
LINREKKHTDIKDLWRQFSLPEENDMARELANGE